MAGGRRRQFLDGLWRQHFIQSLMNVGAHRSNDVASIGLSHQPNENTFQRPVKLTTKEIAHDHDRIMMAATAAATTTTRIFQNNLGKAVPEK